MDAVMDAMHRHKVMTAAVVLTAVVLVANLVAMQASDGASWSAFDFALMSVFLLGFGAILDGATSLFRNSTHKLAIGAGVVAVAALLFVELSVGLVGSPIAGS